MRDGGRTGFGRIGWLTMVTAVLLASVAAVGGSKGADVSATGRAPYAAPSAPAPAATSPVTMTFTANRTSAKPGDRLVFTATATNRSTSLQFLTGTIGIPTGTVLWSHSDWCAPWLGAGFVACYGSEPFPLEPGERRSFFVEVFVRTQAATTMQVRAAFGAAAPVTLRIPIGAGGGVRPGAPRDLVASIDGEAVFLMWQGPAEIGSSEITDYVVQRSSRASGPWTTVSDGRYGGDSGHLGDVPPGGGAGFWYRVAAVNATGTGPYTAAVATRVAGVPSAPRGLTVTPNGAGGQLLVSWQRPAYTGTGLLAEYEVELSGDGGRSWSRVALEAGYEASVRLRGLRPGYRYAVRVAMRNQFGRGAWVTASAVVPVLPAPPSAPRLTAVVISSSQVRLTWTPPASINGSAILQYGWQRSSDGGRTWTGGGAATATSRSVIASGLQSGVAYQFRLAARNSVGWGAMSNIVTARPGPRPPSAPTLTATVVGPNQVRLSWTTPVTTGGPPIVQYGYQRSSDGGRTWAGGGAGDGSSRSVVVGSLVTGRTYHFKVAGRNAVGWGAVSNVVSVTPRVVAPAAPSLSVTVLSSSQVRLTWTAPATGGSPIVDYGYQRLSGSDPTWRGGYGGGASSRSVVVGGLTGQTYSFRVAARNAVGWGAMSNIVVVMPGPRAPSAPGFSAEVAGPGQVRLTWTAPAFDGGPDVSTYGYQISDDGGATWVGGGVSHPANTTVLTGLQDGATYLFKAAARNSVGWGAMTSVVSVTTPATPPPTDPPSAQPSATEPPATEPAATDAPAMEPPETDPPATQPTETDPPVTEPPMTEPPVTEPPETDPPVTEPPGSEAPATDPPGTEAPTADLPGSDPPAA